MSPDFAEGFAPERVEAPILAPGLDGAYRLELAYGSVRRLVPIDPVRLREPAEDPAVLRLGPEFLVVPGFVDGHTHLLGVGTARLKPNLQGSRSKREALERLAAWLTAHPGEDPVIAEGWDQSLWTDPAFPTRAEIDRVAGSRAVVLRRVCGHVAIFGSAALARVGSSWENLDPGSGLAREQLPLAVNRLLPLPGETLVEAVALAARTALAHGVTWAHEMGDARSFRAFAAAGAARRFPVRVSHYFGVDLLDALCATGMRAGFGDTRLRAAGIKIFLDGSFGGRTAAVGAAYADGSGSGELLWSDRDLEDRLRRCAESDLPVALHAIGDRAIQQAIETVTRLEREGVTPAAPGPRLEHAESLTPELAERASASGFFLSMQPNFTARWQGPGQLYEQALGPTRARALNPFRRALETGRLLFGSDTMPLGPALGLRGAIQHPDATERLSGLEALQAYTTAGAAAVRAPFGSARLEQGAPADFVVLRAESSFAQLLRAGTLAESSRSGAGLERGVELAGVREVSAQSPAGAGADVEATWIDGVCRFRAAHDVEVAG